MSLNDLKTSNESREGESDPSSTLAGVNSERPITQLESACMSCGQNGTTTFLITKVPHFREIIVSSFACAHCGNRNNSVQFGGAIQDKAVKYTLKVKDLKDIERQVVKSDTATIIVPELELEIPPESHQGSLSTVEGVLRQVVDGLNQLQPERKKANPEQADTIDLFIAKLMKIIKCESEFTFILEDPAGNSYIESFPGNLDANLKFEHYERSDYQDGLLGINKAIHDKLTARASSIRPAAEAESYDVSIKTEDIKEVINFPTNCSICAAEGQEKMIKLDIPYFKEVVIMSFYCELCGYRNNEIKTGGEISAHGKRICLLVKNKVDLSRDVLKSDTASLFVPEIDLSLGPGTLGGRFSTIEGILYTVASELRNNAFLHGDSADPAQKEKMRNFIANLQELLELKREFHVILEDPLANSFVQNLRAPEIDPQLEEEIYERTPEESERLGITSLEKKPSGETN
eukprot:TRINITY_DN8673_c0_g1_i1.p1 TRINITY_DN8673_c0_g1~~TRINITY_DN8673_c0_g1_i1.p1  ORF type:complete len:461 (+),score=66.40 TRINITY_DN8673_c0_g1_i1:103-1485(+)